MSQKIFRDVFSISLVLIVLHTLSALNVKKEDDLEKTQLELKETLKRKDVFIGKVSHEIRTPLNGIFGLSNKLLEEKKLNQLYTIQQLSLDIKQIFDEIIEFDKLKEGIFDLKIKTFDIIKLIKDIIHRARYLNKNKLEISHFIDPSIPQYIEGDKLKLKEILSNLLINAIKYTPKGSIHLSCNLESNNRNEVCILFKIKDTGIGIKEEDIGKLFSPFLQLHPEVTQMPSTGLGLVICKHLVERMNGKFFVESKFGKGSTFGFTIKVKKSSKKEKKKFESEINKNFAKKYPARILVVEDNRINQIVVMHQLSKLGYENVDLATNGKQAIKMIQEQRPYDLILMDIHMPIMNGLDSTRMIRKMNLEKQPIIYALTACSVKSDKIACNAAGMNGLISKPLHIKKLMEALKSITKHHSSLHKGFFGFES